MHANAEVVRVQEHGGILGEGVHSQTPEAAAMMILSP